MPDHDAVVVGAGSVGLLAACLLIRRGLDVAVRERRVGVDPRNRAIGIHPPGLGALDAAGVGDAVRAEALALRGGDVLSRGRMLASVDFAEGRRVLILPQRRTGALLAERLEGLAPDALRLGCAVVDMREEHDRVRVVTESEGAREELTASLVIVADGVRSGLRDGLGLSWTQRPGAATYAMADVVDRSGGDRARLHCEPGGLVESFPLPGGMRRWVLREDGQGLGDPSAFRTAIAQRVGAELEADPAPVVFAAAQHRVDRVVVGGRIVLLGDAAHEISPIGGQGMNLGWIDAQRLAASVSASGAADLSEFARRGVRAAGRVQRRARFYMSMGAPAGGMPLRVREGLIRALGAPLLRERTADILTMGRL